MQRCLQSTDYSRQLEKVFPFERGSIIFGNDVARGWAPQDSQGPRQKDQHRLTCNKPATHSNYEVQGNHWRACQSHSRLVAKAVPGFSGGADD